MRESTRFPPPEQADAEGIVATGGCLDPDWIIDAYRHGIFPWPLDDGFLTWWSPNPRPILPLDTFHVPRRLARTCRSGRFQVSYDRDFAGVIEACATVGDRPENAWLLPEMRASYKQLHHQGHTHSVEIWHEGQLAGGVYGVAVGGAFSAESMFHRVRDASKVALVHLVEHLRERGYELLDIQQLTPHVQQFGATEIPRRQFLRRLRALRDLPIRFLD